MHDLVYILGAYYLLTRGNVKTSLETTLLRWPVQVLGADGLPIEGRGGSAITQEYRPPSHMGVDISVVDHFTDARANVLAVATGRVVRAARGERGFAVLLDHGDWASGYLHLADIFAGVGVGDWRAGDIVQAGQRLGRMGADPLDPQRIVHLHLQIAPGGHTTDPAPYLRKAV